MIGRFVALGLAALLAACAGPTVKTDFDPNGRFGSYRSYSWIAADRGGSPLVQQRIVERIDAKLQAAGWKKAASGGDVNVAAHVTTRTGQNYNTFYSGIGHDLRWFGVNAPDSVTMSVDEYKQGTLVVDMFDAASKRAIWRASASGTLPDDPALIDSAVQGAVDKMFAGFPPGAKQAR